MFEHAPPRCEEPASIELAMKSDRGRRRRRNEDRAVVMAPGTGYIGEAAALIVADGLGGHGDGDRASELAVGVMASYASRILPWLTRCYDGGYQMLEDELERGIHRLHRRISEVASREGLSRTMGTTLTMCYVERGIAHIAHAGDSRCYLLLDGRLTQITRDHTYANLLRDNGALLGEGDNKWLDNALVNCLGGGVGDVSVEFHHVELHAGGCLLLCSDGLTKHVPDSGIERILASEESAMACCEALVAAANDGGGSDNITVAVARL